MICILLVFRLPLSIMTVDEFDSTASPKADEIVASLIRNGGCVIRNMIKDQNVLDTIEKDIRPHLEADEPWAGVDFFPQKPGA